MTKQNSNIFSLIGASNHALAPRAEYDLYCTHPDAVTELLKIEKFNPYVWECCDGLGHMSNVLIQSGYNVRRSDILTRSRNIEQIDFLNFQGTWVGDIITNPPYSHAIQFVRKAIEVIPRGYKVAMFLRTLFLESKARKELFKQHPPKRIWVSSRRIPCGINGEFGASAQSYSWYIWEKGYSGDTIINWF